MSASGLTGILAAVGVAVEVRVREEGSETNAELLGVTRVVDGMAAGGESTDIEASGEADLSNMLAVLESAAMEEGVGMSGHAELCCVLELLDPASSFAVESPFLF